MHIRKSSDLGALIARLGDARKAHAALVNAVIAAADGGEKTTHLARLIQSSAWTEAALALIDLELPFWQIRRLAYDNGEWYCALSRERELPDWLDQSIEARHADLALAILSAFVEARRIEAPQIRANVPDVGQPTRDFYETLPVDNCV